MRAPPDRHRDHVCGPLAVRVDGARSSDPQGVDGLHDRRGDRAGGDRHRTLLLFAIPHDRFRIDIGDTLVDCGADHRVDLAGAVTRFHDWRGIGTGIGGGRNLALASLPLAPAFRLTNQVRQLALPLPKRTIPLHSHSSGDPMISSQGGLAQRVRATRGLMTGSGVTHRFVADEWWITPSGRIRPTHFSDSLLSKGRQVSVVNSRQQ
jgi:hypothetical protein